MTTPVPFRFEVDYTAENPDNYVHQEPHDLDTKRYRSIAPKEGAFYSSKLSVTDMLGGRLLVKGVDYRCLNISTIASAVSNHEVCTLILITNQAVSARVMISYQAVGGPYERSVGALKVLLDNLLKDDRPVNYPDIVNRPNEFTPAPHFQHAGATIGYEFLVYELERLRSALLLGDEYSHEQIYIYIKNCLEMVEKTVRDMNVRLYRDALLAAQTASNNATGAVLAFNKQNDDINKLQFAVVSGVEFASSVFSQNANSEDLAKTLLAGYAAKLSTNTTKALPIKPTEAVLGELKFPIVEAIGICNASSFFYNLNGEFKEQSTDKPGLIVSLKSIKERMTGKASLELSIEVVDSQNGDMPQPYVDDVVLTLFPFNIGIERKPVEVACFEATYLLVDKERRNDAKYEVGNSGTGMLDLSNDLVIKTNASKEISSALLDFRCDYNAAGFGALGNRNAVSFMFSKGMSLTFKFKLVGLNVSDIRGIHSLLMSLAFNIKQDNFADKPIGNKNNMKALSVSF